MNFWDKVAEGYDKSSEKSFKEANEKTINYTKKYCKRSDELLDIGCGTGMLTVQLTDYVKHITAVDQSEKMLEIAQNRNKDNKIAFILSDEKNSSLQKDAYNIITAFNLLLYIKQDDDFIKNVYDCITEGGYFICVSDCMGECNGAVRLLMKLFIKLKIIPFMHFFTIKELESKITNIGFKIEYTEILDKKSGNYYIAAKK